MPPRNNPHCQYRVYSCVLVLLLAGAARPDDAVSLRFAAKPGEQRIYRVVSTVEQKQSVGGMSLNIKSTETEIAVWTLQKTDETGRLHWQSENMRLTVKAESEPFGKYTFDTNSSDRDRSSYLGGVLTPIYESLNRAYLRVAHDARGRVAAVDDYEELVGEQVKDNPYALQFTFGGTDKGAALWFQEMLPILPEKPVEPGDSWTVPYNFELPNIGRVKGKKTFRYEGPGLLNGEKTARLSFSYDVAFEMEGEADGAKFSGSLPITRASGTAHFDPAAGRLLSLDSRVAITGSLSLEISGNTVAVPTEIARSVKVELLAKLPETR